MPEQYESRYAVVRIHEGKRTEAERRQALEESARRFHMAIEKSKKAVKQNDPLAESNDQRIQRMA